MPPTVAALPEKERPLLDALRARLDAPIREYDPIETHHTLAHTHTHRPHTDRPTHNIQTHIHKYTNTDTIHANTQDACKSQT